MCRFSAKRKKKGQQTYQVQHSKEDVLPLFCNPSISLHMWSNLENLKQQDSSSVPISSLLLQCYIYSSVFCADATMLVVFWLVYYHSKELLNSVGHSKCEETSCDNGKQIRDANLRASEEILIINSCKPGTWCKSETKMKAFHCWLSKHFLKFSGLEN